MIHHKRQDVLASAFSEMSDLHEQGWELHLVGSLKESDLKAVQYLNDVMSQAKGYPIHFHANLERDELNKLYQESAIYWHATGLGQSEHDHPYAQEHFGITTVEAISGGCVPVVINTGGQAETVTHGVNGYLWEYSDGRATCASVLANDIFLQEKIAIAASERAGGFDRTAFNERIDKVLNKIGDYLS